MNDHADLRLSEILSARLCHELVAPVGAVVNGLELLTLGRGATDEEVLSLIEESGRRASARLKFYRLAYGATEDDTMVGSAVLSDLVAGFLEGSRVTADWPDGTPTLPRAAARLLLNLLVLAAGTLPRGGAVSLDGRVCAMASGEQVDLSAAHWSTVAAARAGAIDIGELDAHCAHAAFTGRLAAAQNVALAAHADAFGRLIFSAIL